jgi:hypothetical protein
MPSSRDSDTIRSTLQKGFWSKFYLKFFYLRKVLDVISLAVLQPFTYLLLGLFKIIQSGMTTPLLKLHCLLVGGSS